MCKTHFGRGVISAAASDVTTISDESGIQNRTFGLREWVYLKHDKKIKKSFVQFVSNQFNMTFPKPSFQLLGVYLIHHYLVAIYRIMQMTIIIKERNSCRAKSYWDPLNGRWWRLSLSMASPCIVSPFWSKHKGIHLVLLFWFLHGIEGGQRIKGGNKNKHCSVTPFTNIFLLLLMDTF